MDLDYIFHMWCTPQQCLKDLMIISNIKVKYEHFKNGNEYLTVTHFVLLPGNGYEAHIQDSNMYEPTASNKFFRRSLSLLKYNHLVFYESIFLRNSQVTVWQNVCNIQLSQMPAQLQLLLLFYKKVQMPKLNSDSSKPTSLMSQ